MAVKKKTNKTPEVRYMSEAIYDDMKDQSYNTPQELVDDLGFRDRIYQVVIQPLVGEYIYKDEE